jgi:hypothetical protein
VKLPRFKVLTEREEVTETLQGHETPEGHMEYELLGDRIVTIEWQTKTGKQTKKERKGSKK